MMIVTDDVRLKKLMEAATPQPDPAQLALLRRRLLAPAAAAPVPVRPAKRWWVWGVATAGAALAVALLALLMVPGAETPPPAQHPVPIAAPRVPVAQAKAQAPIKQTYRKVFDDPKQVIFEWEDYSGAEADPLGLVNRDDGVLALF